MNGLNKIQDKIISDAKASAEEIISEAKAKAEAQKQQARTEADKAAAAILEESSKKAQSIIRAAQSSAQLQGKNKLLSTKGSIMNEVISSAHEQLLGLGDSEYFEIITALAVKLSRDEDGQMLFNKRDLDRLPRGYGRNLSRKIKGTLTVSDTPCDIDGGFILVYGGIEENCSFDALFNAQYDKIRDIISPVLF